MASILVLQGNYSDAQVKFFNQISTALASKGFEVTERNYRDHRQSPDFIANDILSYDAIVVLGFAVFSNDFIKNKTYDIIRAQNPNDIKVILIGREGQQKELHPDLLGKVLFFGYEMDDSHTLKSIVADIADVVTIRALRKDDQTKNQKAAAVVQNIQLKAPDYIRKNKTDLENIEVSLKNTASKWYDWSVISLVLSILTAIIMLAYTARTDFAGDWVRPLFVTIKGIILITLLLSSAKYCLSLAKAYTSEALKIADRIHAIAFGDFYIKVFENELKSSELKEIFRDWNINNQTNSFSKDSSGDLDIKMLEKVLDLADRMRPTGKS